MTAPSDPVLGMHTKPCPEEVLLVQEAGAFAFPLFLVVVASVFLQFLEERPSWDHRPLLPSWGTLQDLSQGHLLEADWRQEEEHILDVEEEEHYCIAEVVEHYCIAEVEDSIHLALHLDHNILVAEEEVHIPDVEEEAAWSWVVHEGWDGILDVLCFLL